MNRPTLLVRPVEENDLISLCDIANKMVMGLPSLQNDEKILKAKIKRSINSFAQKNEERSRLFFFVLEDMETRKIIGTSAIEAEVAYYSPYYSYYVTTLIQKYVSLAQNETIQIEQQNKILYLSNDYQESSLLCSLYVDPHHRALGQGSLLSRIRYLFIAEHPDFFEDRLIAEMRGVYDGNMQFPFWDHLGQHFYNMDIIQAEKMLALEGTRIITDLNPRLPIYTSLLPLVAQKAIAEVNVNTKPALHVLEKEGFTYQNHIDVFDGGPIVEAKKKDIRTLRTSQIAVFTGFIKEGMKKQSIENTESSEQNLYIVCNARLDFRATLGLVLWHKENEVYLEESVVKLLQLSLGDKLRLSAFR